MSAFIISTSMMAFIELAADTAILQPSSDNESPRTGQNITAAIIANGFVIFTVLTLWAMIYTAISQYRERQQDALNQLKLEAALKDSQLASLTRQVNPHFIFNALNNIRSLIRKNQNSAIDMITALSEVLRCSLSHHSKATVPLMRELELIEDYIALAKLQFGSRLTYLEKIDQSATNLAIPPMSLQTLVENAIKHGIGQLKDGGVITLSVNKGDDKYVLSVRNTGSLKPSDSNGTGIWNLRERVSLIYGPQSKVELMQEGGEVIAYMHIPTHFSEHE